MSLYIPSLPEPPRTSDPVFNQWAQQFVNVLKLWVAKVTRDAMVSVAGADHGALAGLADDDHTQYHNDARGDARYFRETEHLSASAGAGDAGKPIVLDAGGRIDATMIDDADVAHDSTSGAAASAVHDGRYYTEAEVDAAIANMVETTDAAYIDLTDGGESTAHVHDGRYRTESELSSTSTGQGAAMIGVEDAAGKIASGTVEGALAEIVDQVPQATYSWGFDLTNHGMFDSDTASGFSTTAETAMASATAADNAVWRRKGQMGATVDSRYMVQFGLPSEVDTARDISATVFGEINNAGGGSDVIQLEWEGRAVADNEDMDAAGATLGPVTLNVAVHTHAANDAVLASFGVVISGGTLADDDFIHCVVRRNGTAGADTYTGAFRALYLRFAGTRKTL
jgi:hypothetical protein